MKSFKDNFRSSNYLSDSGNNQLQPLVRKFFLAWSCMDSNLFMKLANNFMTVATQLVHALGVSGVRLLRILGILGRHTYQQVFTSNIIKTGLAKEVHNIPHLLLSHEAI